MISGVRRLYRITELTCLLNKTVLIPKGRSDRAVSQYTVLSLILYNKDHESLTIDQQAFMWRALDKELQG